MSNHRISIDSPEGGSGILDLISMKADDSEGVMRIAGWIQSIGTGAKNAKLRFNANAVQASGTVTFSSFIADDTVTVNGNTLTGKASPAGANQFAIGSTDQDCANNLAIKINASTLAKIAGCVGASRRATILLSSFATADTVTINNVIFTGKTTPSDSVREEFLIGGTDTISATNLAAAINRSIRPEIAGIVATASSATVTINLLGSITASSSAHSTVTSTIVVVTALSPGQMGNLGTLAISAHGSVSGANLTSGTEGTEYVFDKNYVAV